MIRDPQEEIRRREERLAKVARVREALRKEVAEARSSAPRAGGGARKRAEDVARPPAKRAEAATLAKKRDRQASLFDDDLDPSPPSTDADLPRTVPPHRPGGTPKPKAQRNFTDPDRPRVPHVGTGSHASSAALPSAL